GPNSSDRSAACTGDAARTARRSDTDRILRLPGAGGVPASPAAAGGGDIACPWILIDRLRDVRVGKPLPARLASAADEGKQVAVDRVGMGGAHAVGKSRIDLQRRVAQQLCRKQGGVLDGHDLVV